MTNAADSFSQTLVLRLAERIQILAGFLHAGAVAIVNRQHIDVLAGAGVEHVEPIATRPQPAGQHGVQARIDGPCRLDAPTAELDVIARR